MADTKPPVPGALRRRIDSLIHKIRLPNASVADILEAEAVLGRMHEGGRTVSREVFSGIERASEELVAEGVFDPSATMIDPILQSCRRANIPESRISLLRQVVDASDIARVHGLWVEYLFLRSSALIMAEPTGIALTAMRAELYRRPNTPLLIELSLEPSDSIIASAMEAARISLDLAEAIAGANSENGKENSCPPN